MSWPSTSLRSPRSDSVGPGRGLHAQLIEKLRQAGAKVVAFDIIFAEPTTEAADAAFAKAAWSRCGPGRGPGLDPLEQGVQVTRVDPLDIFLDAGADEGLTSVAARRRRGLAAHAGCSRQLSRPGPSAKAGRTAAAAGRWPLIQYFGPPRSYPTVSYYQALDPTHFCRRQIQGPPRPGGIEPQGRGDGRCGCVDAFPTPYTLNERKPHGRRRSPGHDIDNLLHDLYVVPIPRPAMLILVIVVALLAAFLCRAASTGIRDSSAILLLALLMSGAGCCCDSAGCGPRPSCRSLRPCLVVGARFGIDYARERRMRRGRVACLLAIPLAGSRGAARA